MNANIIDVHTKQTEIFKVIQNKAKEITEILPIFEKNINEKSKNIEASKNLMVEQMTMNFNVSNALPMRNVKD